MTYGARSDIAVGRVNGSLEYRLAIDNREYQRSLSRLQFLVTSAGRHGCAVRVRI